MKSLSIKTLVAVSLLAGSSASFAATFADFSNKATTTYIGPGRYTVPTNNHHQVTLNVSSGAKSIELFEKVQGATSFTYSATPLIGTAQDWVSLDGGITKTLLSSSAENKVFTFAKPFTGTIEFGASVTSKIGADSLLIKDLNVAAVPEPEEYALMMSGLAVMGWRLRQLKNTAANRSLAVA